MEKSISYLDWELQLKMYSQFSIDYINISFFYDVNRLDCINDAKLKTIFSKFFLNIEEHFPISLFTGTYHRASDIRLVGSVKNPLSYRIIVDFFINSKHLIKEIKKSDNLFFICKIAKKVYTIYNSVNDLWFFIKKITAVLDETS